jgi:RNA polymerase sigma factor (sigma-70 family)
MAEHLEAQLEYYGPESEVYGADFLATRRLVGDPIATTSYPDTLEGTGWIDTEDLVPTQEKIDAEIESLLGMPLPPIKKMSHEEERRLRREIKAGNPDAQIEYLAEQARLTYDVVSQIPEACGLTLEDYFQIGCETVLTLARDQNAEVNHYPSELRKYIASTVKGELRAQQFGSQPAGEPYVEDSVDSFPEESDDPDAQDPLRQIAKEWERAYIYYLLRKSKIAEYRERGVLQQRFGIGGTKPLTLDEVGPKWNVTRERVRQIENRALKKLQNAIPEHTFIRMTFENVRPDCSEVAQARYDQADAAREVQIERDRRIAEDAVLAQYPTPESEDMSRQERLVRSLATMTLGVIGSTQYVRPNASNGHYVEDVHHRVGLRVERGGKLRKEDFIRALNLLSDEGEIVWVEPQYDDAPYTVISRRSWLEPNAAETTISK